MATTEVASGVTERVRSALADAGVSMLSLAETTGIPRTTLIRRLNGHSPFTVVELLLIARVLGVSAQSFFPKEAA